MILYTGWKETKNRRQEANMCQFLINTLEDDVFGLPLDHITGEAIAEGDPRSLKDLLEIFCEISEEFGRRSPLAGNSYISMCDNSVSDIKRHRNIAVSYFKWQRNIPVSNIK